MKNKEYSLDFRDLKHFSTALLGRQGWLLMVEPGTHFSRFLALNITRTEVSLIQIWDLTPPICAGVFGLPKN